MVNLENPLKHVVKDYKIKHYSHKPYIEISLHANQQFKAEYIYVFNK